MEPTERPGRAPSGAVFVVIEVILVAVCAAVFLTALRTENVALGLSAIPVLLAAIVLPTGFFIVQPNMARALVFFGRYKGTVRANGFFWANPLYRKTAISLRIRNLDSDVLKVNDAAGNPVEIAAVINWQVFDSAKALFNVESFHTFVEIQTETAVRHVASEYPYDNYDDEGLSLRGNAEEVTETLQHELQERLQVAGVAVLDTRLRRLAYAPEIAGEMLKRQQASAVVAARKLIVEGAVGMVDHALQMLNDQRIVELDEERKASMVSNLLVVLCSDRGAQPVVNSGSLY
ncbi:MAG: SPFH domain-containing protein [Acidimicrobiales bacterium]|nr:SPFH domain-containing protein [Actinomycetota bacterium]